MKRLRDFFPVIGVTSHSLAASFVFMDERACCKRIVYNLLRRKNTFGNHMKAMG